MYPETDVLPVIVDDERWNGMTVPELLTAKAQRYAQEYAIDQNYATRLALSEKLPLFERAVAEGIKPKLAVFTILSTCTELRREGVDSGEDIRRRLSCHLACRRKRKSSKRGNS